ncbi:hypothetical protein NF867_09340 [Solitalea sp. MAHUQ-68]|uniref:Uncharacterized protein n=2 Tax=Solitalea TaxID=929509 RepID=A0A2S4ZXL4_9SPHI|nr:MULTISPECIES: hypothetical protein [Solitalea]MCO4293066.1 hypothetical protein [Solitalea agri]POY34652.1 hypothetical protein C3K47_19075 [Solitalea longa]POY34716.1 hypothetical protein C3K47_18965 [Solitalea longa]POY35466.1 hypothetical protein C3K47_15515 [Solitalea longa]
MSELGIFFGSLISLLLSVVAYFIRQLHTDFRKVERDLSEVKTTTSLIKSEFKNGYDLLNQKVSYLEKRIEILEHQQFKNYEH